jgi:tetratricopeptide (TPR) repeat protein
VSRVSRTLLSGSWTSWASCPTIASNDRIVSKGPEPVNIVSRATSSRNRISVCLIVRNESLLLRRCLDSVAPIAHEIIVVDTGSTDDTRSIARSCGARVIEHEWIGYARARNAYLEAATGEWVLVIDGDEAIAAADLPRIRRLVRRPNVIGYRLLVRNYTDDFDLLWRWSPNDGRYPREERFSRCEGWMRTDALRLFRNFQDVRYPDVASTHATPMTSLRTRAGTIDDRHDVVIHHYQHLKGGARFIAMKQRRRLPLELRQVRQAPSDRDALLNSAKTLFAEGADAEAARMLRRALRIDPRFHDACQLMAMIDFERGRLASAEAHARKAIAIDASSSDAWCVLGMSLAEHGRALEARDALLEAQRLHPGHLFAHNSLGVVYEDLGELAAAGRQYRAALRLHRRFAPARTNLARVSRTAARSRRRIRRD